MIRHPLPAAHVDSAKPRGSRKHTRCRHHSCRHQSKVQVPPVPHCSITTVCTTMAQSMPPHSPHHIPSVVCVATLPCSLTELADGKAELPLPIPDLNLKLKTGHSFHPIHSAYAIWDIPPCHFQSAFLPMGQAYAQRKAVWLPARHPCACMLIHHILADRALSLAVCLQRPAACIDMHATWNVSVHTKLSSAANTSVEQHISCRRAHVGCEKSSCVCRAPLSRRRPANAAAGAAVLGPLMQGSR